MRRPHQRLEAGSALLSILFTVQLADDLAPRSIEVAPPAVGQPGPVEHETGMGGVGRGGTVRHATMLGVAALSPSAGAHAGMGPMASR